MLASLFFSIFFWQEVLTRKYRYGTLKQKYWTFIKMKIPVKVKIDGVTKLDKYEYNLKLEEIDKLVDQGDYEEAANLADTIEWKRVRNVRTLCLISEIYEAAGRLPDSKRILERAYRKTPVGRNVLYRLVEVTTALQEYDEALEYYTEYVQAAPHDNNRYILKYKLYRGRGSSVEELIAILEEYLGQEYTERWAYELAKLYRQAGQMQKCLAACDDLVLWFHSGKYVQKALELKRKYAALTPKQQQIYEECVQEAAESRLEQEEEHEQQEPEATAEPAPEPVVDLGSTDGEMMAEKIIAETEKEIAEEVTAQTQKVEQQEQKGGEETVQAPTRKLGGAAEPPKAVPETPQTAQAAAPKPFNPEELQVNLARSMREIVSGVGHRPEIPEEDVPASVESRPRMTQKVEVPNTKIPTAGKLSIDDILLSMGERGKDYAAARAGHSTAQPAAAPNETTAAVQEPENSETEAAATVAAEEVVQETPQATEEAAQNPGREEAAASVPEQSAEPEMTADEALDPEAEPATTCEEEPVPETPVATDAEQADHVTEATIPSEAEDTNYPGMEAEQPETTRQERPRRPLPRRSVAEAAVEDLTDAQREALQYTSNPERLLRNKRSLPTYTEEAAPADRTMPAEAQGFAAEQKQGIAPDLGATRKAPSREELLEAARKDLHAKAAMHVPAERAEMPQSTAKTGVQPQPEEEVPMAEQPYERPQNDPEAEYDDWDESYEESPQESDEDYREPDADYDESEEEPYYDDDYLMIPEHLRGLFSGFTEIPELEDQIANAIIQAQSKGDDRTSKSGNILIFGAHGSGKTTLAMNLAKAIAQDRGSQVVKMAKIFAADLNKKDIASTVAKIAGGTLIIEEAGDLDDETVDQLTTAMEFRTDGLILILEDEQKYVHELLMRHPRFTMKFTAQIYIPDYTVEELEMFGQIYANEQDYMIGDEGWDALYEKISALAAVKANDNEPVTIKDVIDMVAKAINHANGFFRKMKMGQKRYDENDYVILFAKDFGR